MIRTFILIAVSAVVCGCASTPGRPHTEYEKRLFANAVLGHSIDVLTTYATIDPGEGIEEGNPVVRSIIDSDGEFMALKSGQLALTYIVGSIFPEQRVQSYKISAMLGYGPALWNMGIKMGF